ncbi:MAG: 2-succinyl-6-hydroxy-2,4-cyclohexadiene-1-carboxylate synthase [Chlamydiae bacterium]|nr:2-succinyl-6-hydroxy-2,4-cyclohexadiene-1-carboxylate synthase [Chlamydiota bacterium]
MLLFLHGFLGQKEDWDPLFSHLPPTLKPCAIDLPGHGKAPMVDDIALAIKQQVNSADIIVGYSAGGRLALELKSRFPDAFGKVIALSTHPGSLCEKEMKTRNMWAQMLRSIPLDHFLEKWYDQELFQSLKRHPIFPSMLARRKNQNPSSLSQFFMEFSRVKKTAPQVFPETVFIYGEEDLKYAELYRKLFPIEQIKIENAGHALHLENPKTTAQVIERLVHEHSRKHQNPSTV